MIRAVGETLRMLIQNNLSTRQPTSVRKFKPQRKTVKLEKIIIASNILTIFILQTKTSSRCWSDRNWVTIFSNSSLVLIKFSSTSRWIPVSQILDNHKNWVNTLSSSKTWIHTSQQLTMLTKSKTSEHIKRNIQDHRCSTSIHTN